MLEISQHPTIKEIHNHYIDGAKVEEVLEVFFDRIEKQNDELGALLRIENDFASNIAAHLEELLSQNSIEDILSEMPLFGIPFILKDNVLVEGLVASSASKILEDFISTYSADIYTNLEKAGGVLIGFANQDEFAFGSSTEYSAYQKTFNPYDFTRVPGGSSGGSAASVAAGFSVFSIGSDTGGSVRQPASFCGLVGNRPTYGQVSRYGVMSAASSFDQPGTFTNSVDDNYLINSILSKPTDKDSKNLRTGYTFSPQPLSKKIKIGILKEAFAEGVDQEVLDLIEGVKEKNSDKFEYVEISIPSFDYSLAAYYILMTVESAANLERYDGVRYGPQVEEGQMFYSARDQFFGEEVKRRIMLGTYASSAGYYDAFYNKAALVREKIKIEFEKAFESVDAIMTPVAPTPAFKFGDNIEDPVQMYLADIMTLPPALAQNASISIPTGTIEKEGKSLPVGLQIIADVGEDQKMYQIASAFVI